MSSALAGRFLSTAPAGRSSNYIFMSVGTCGYFIFWVIIQCYFILLIKLFQLWPLEVLSLLGPFNIPPRLWQFLFSKNYLYSGIRCSRLILCISCSSLRISCFSKELLFFLLENGIRKQDLGATCVCYYCSSFILGPLRMIYVYTNLYIYTYQKIFP